MDERVTYTGCYFERHYGSPVYRLYLRMRNACVYRAVCAYQPSGRLLEIGFGNGNLIRTFARRFECYGVDISPAALEAMRRHIGGVDVERFRLCDVEQEPVPFAVSFDVVCAMNVVEHFANPRLVLERVHRALRPGGFLALYLPTRSNRLSRWLYRRFYDVEEHIYRPSIADVRTLLASLGFRVRRELAAHLFPLAISLEQALQSTNLYFGIWQRS
ncbi:MAG: methyltransferase domain-containing protein [Ardenticatenia bacterium]|nr:methyltransferase domain-containing protein [Ardenticatenia bacterium]